VRKFLTSPPAVTDPKEVIGCVACKSTLQIALAV
jgi:hypothetical protein